MTDESKVTTREPPAHPPAERRPVRYESPTYQRGGFMAERPQLPYLLPFLAYLAFFITGEYFGHAFGLDWQAIWWRYFPIIYLAKTVAAALMLWVCWKYYTPIRWTHLKLGALVGLIGVPLWVGVEYLAQYAGLHAAPDPSRPYTIYNAVKEIPDPAWRWMFYIIRVGGPTLVVPIMEELFFRDFIQRALIRGARFQEVPVGTFTWLSLLGMAALFGINHGVMWPSGVLYGLLMGILLIRTKSLGACIVAHGVTNLVLYAGYCIPFGVWQFM